MVVEANRRWGIVLDVPLASIVGKHLLDFAPGASAAIGAELDAAIAYGSRPAHWSANCVARSTPPPIRSTRTERDTFTGQESVA